jgi:predicted membrane protein
MIHTPTLLLINILVTATLALCLGAVSTRGQRDGLLWWAWGLAAHTLAYVLIGLRGQIPDGLSVVLGNTLMTTSLALIAEGVYQFQQRKPQRGWVWTPVVVMLVAFSFLQANIQARVLLNAVLLSFQCVLLLGLILGRRHVTPGRGQYFVVAGLMLLLTLLLLRGVGALTGWMQLTSITDSSVVQAATFIFATLGIMLIALGLVLMTKEEADERNRRLALQDELTGLHNRRFILEVLAQQLALARRNNRPLAVMILDLDYSSASTTRTAIWSGTRCCAMWRRASRHVCARRISPGAGAARSSSSSCPTPTPAVPPWWPSSCGRRWSRRTSSRPRGSPCNSRSASACRHWNPGLRLGVTNCWAPPTRPCTWPSATAATASSGLKFRPCAAARRRRPPAPGVARRVPAGPANRRGHF